MSTIFYGVCGEGRGHAARVRTIVEELRSRHNIHIFAPAMAYEMLAPIYRDSGIHVHHIPGLCFAYGNRCQVDYLKTGWQAAQYLAGLNAQIRRVTKAIEKHAPDLVITDFEPIVSRAAERCGVPYISLDHQQFMLSYDLSSLPGYLRRHAFYMSRMIKAYYSRQRESIVSSFYFPPLRTDVANVTQIGVLLRPEILAASRERGKHLVAYLRRKVAPSVFQALEGSGCEVRIYGQGQQPSRGNLKFLPIDFDRFIDDLAASRALISTAGNQLIGEALYLDKPVLAMPEPNNYEQHINAHFLQRSGGGRTVDMAKLTAGTIRGFLDSFADSLPLLNRARLHGTPTALRIINSYAKAVPPARSAEFLPQLEFLR